MLRSVSAGKLAITTSAVLMSRAATSRPSGFDTSSVMPRLPRLTWRYMAPTPSDVTGVIHRSSPPSTRSTRITSAPRSASNAPQYGPAMYRPKSTTRVPSSTPMDRPPSPPATVGQRGPRLQRAHGPPGDQRVGVLLHLDDLAVANL